VISAAIQEIRGSGILERVRELAVVHARSAVEVVDSLPDSECRDGIRTLIENLVSRDL
jgi:hypothetical protein